MSVGTPGSGSERRARLDRGRRGSDHCGDRRLDGECDLRLDAGRLVAIIATSQEQSRQKNKCT